MLEALAHRHAPLGMIHEYVGYLRENPKDRTGSFRSFVTNRGYGDEKPSRSLVQRTFHKAMEQAGGELEARRQAAPPAV